ncbi:MAG TPA: hydrogenase maturation protease [Acidimicrobiales bacterium]|nr:hydrogenase maturation protease [Acidimicrobiales bacterium]
MRCGWRSVDWGCWREALVPSRSGRTRPPPLLARAAPASPGAVGQMRILIAGVGNTLRADDGFGVEVAHKLEARQLPAGVSVVETGIGGIALVQELQSGYDALVVIDCVDLGRPPGNVMLIEPEVVDVNALSWSERHDLLADMHLATPERAMMLARALGVLPANVLMVGCQPVDPDAVGQGLSAPVAAAVDVAVAEIVRHVEELLAAEAAAATGAQPGS